MFFFFFSTSQAVNKLAEVMNRRETVRGGHRGTGTEVHRKEKENRKLQLELRAEKEKLNSTIIKYQREMTEMQAVSTQTLQYGQNDKKAYRIYCHVYLKNTCFERFSLVK